MKINIKVTYSIKHPKRIDITLEDFYDPELATKIIKKIIDEIEE